MKIFRTICIFAMSTHLSVACQESPKPTKADMTASDSPKSTPAPSAKPEPKRPLTSESKPNTSSKILDSDGRTFDNKWIVILGALDKEGKPPKEWVKTQAKLSALGSTPVTTWSDYFKGLMPCWNILIGGSFETKDAAKAFSKKLKKAGINNYFKHAGKYVGKDPRVQQACKQTVRGSVRDVPFFPIVQWDGHALVPVAAPEPVLERAMEKAKPMRDLPGSNRAWLETLIPIKVGDLSVGNAVKVYGQDGASSKTCKVKRFVALTWGQPHFSTLGESPDEDGPNCGLPQVMAQLDCGLGGEGEFSIGAFPEVKLKMTPLQDAFSRPVATVQLNEVQQQTLSHPAVASMQRAAQKHALEFEQEVKVQFKSNGLSERAHDLVHVTYFTGEGYDACGGEDFFDRKSAVFRSGEPASKFVTTEYHSYQASVRFKNQYFFLIRSAYGTMFLKDADGQVVDSILKAFCDCEC